MNFFIKEIIMRAVLSIIMCFICFCAKAQSNLFGTVVAAPDSVGVCDCNIALVCGDSICYETKPELDGGFFIGGVTNGDYTVEVDGLGYETFRQEISVDENMMLIIVLQPLSSINLGEVIVSADRSDMVKRTHDGQIFYLSDDAKNKRNPFMALQEIPLLISNPNTSQIQTIDGVTPLILIDGNRVNSGIAPIDPQEIESVEVITNPSARYLKYGYKSVVNIKLKRKQSPYQWFELATRHDIPLNYGFGVGYFEVGDPKYSLYGRAVYNYRYHDDYDMEMSRTDTGYVQQFSQCQRFDGWNWVGELLFKANPTRSNYFAAHLFGTTETKKNSLNGSGDMTIVEQDALPYDFNGNARNESAIITGSAYYKHSFENNSEIEARVAYNFNKNDYADKRIDEYESEQPSVYSYEQQFHNKRQSGLLQIDYSNSYSDYGIVTAGAHTSLRYDRVTHASQPYSRFKHREISQYVYAGWVNKFWNKVWFVATAGIDGIWLKADESSNQYFRPRVSLGLTWIIDSHHSVGLDYQLTNTAPEVGQLNPYNTSTDIMTENVGNPYLLPQSMHYLPLTYTYNIEGLYIRPIAYYKRINDMISRTGYTNANGVFVSTYENLGHFSQVLAALDVSYRLNHGRVYAKCGWYANYYTGQPRHNMFFVQGGFNYTLDKFSFYGKFGYQDRSIDSDISWTRYYKPLLAELQVNYNITPDFYIGACLQHFTGKYHSKTTIETGSYIQIEDIYHVDRNLRPWVILRYTFRRNESRKIKLDNVLESKEQGISITP